MYQIKGLIFCMLFISMGSTCLAALRRLDLSSLKIASASGSAEGDEPCDGVSTGSSGSDFSFCSNPSALSKGKQLRVIIPSSEHVSAQCACQMQQKALDVDGQKRVRDDFIFDHICKLHGGAAAWERAFALAKARKKECELVDRMVAVGRAAWDKSLADKAALFRRDKRAFFLSDGEVAALDKKATARMHSIIPLPRLAPEVVECGGAGESMDRSTAPVVVPASGFQIACDSYKKTLIRLFEVFVRGGQKDSAWATYQRLIKKYPGAAGDAAVVKSYSDLLKIK